MLQILVLLLKALDDNVWVHFQIHRYLSQDKAILRICTMSFALLGIMAATAACERIPLCPSCGNVCSPLKL